MIEGRRDNGSTPLYLVVFSTLGEQVNSLLTALTLLRNKIVGYSSNSNYNTTFEIISYGYEGTDESPSSITLNYMPVQGSISNYKLTSVVSDSVTALQEDCSRLTEQT